MRAIVITKYGSADGLQLKEVDTPIPRDDEVLIKIFATTVTSGDVVLRRLKFPLRLVFRLFFNLGRNKILGHELAGVVEETGGEVTLFKPGDLVFASTGNRGGAHADYICLPEGGSLAGKPARLTFEEAAAVPVGGNTALFILKSGNLRAGQKVLIYGASGSVGTYAVQLAKYFETEVTGVCSTANLELVKSLGADEVIDYTREDLSQGAGAYDVVFDAVGKLSPGAGKKLLTEDGTYLSVQSSTKENPQNLVNLGQLIEAGKLKPVIDRSYPFEQIPEAHRYVEKGHKKGNVAVTVEGGSL